MSKNTSVSFGSPPALVAHECQRLLLWKTAIQSERQPFLGRDNVTLTNVTFLIVTCIHVTCLAVRRVESSIAWPIRPACSRLFFWNKSALSLGSPGAGLPTCVDPLLGLACKLASKNIEPGICRAFLVVVGTGLRHCLNHDFFD
jgi:hypothetical protein